MKTVRSTNEEPKEPSVKLVGAKKVQGCLGEGGEQIWLDSMYRMFLESNIYVVKGPKLCGWLTCAIFLHRSG